MVMNDDEYFHGGGADDIIADDVKLERWQAFVWKSTGKTEYSLFTPEPSLRFFLGN